MSELNYMGVQRDGKFVTVAAPTMPEKDLARELEQWVREGLSVERCDDEFVRTHFGRILFGPVGSRY